MPAFSEKVYGVVGQIPKGQVVTYKEVAEKIGQPKAFRAVGSVLNKNMKLIRIPCHRVIKSNGHVGGYVKGKEQKIKLLKEEGVVINNEFVDLKNLLRII